MVLSHSGLYLQDLCEVQDFVGYNNVFEALEDFCIGFDGWQL